MAAPSSAGGPAPLLALSRGAGGEKAGGLFQGPGAGFGFAQFRRFPKCHPAIEGERELQIRKKHDRGYYTLLPSRPQDLGKNNEKTCLCTAIVQTIGKQTGNTSWKNIGEHL
ncbi:uncharacterized protein FYW23_007920 isoform 1-T1 [Sylvia borin]